MNNELVLAEAQKIVTKYFFPNKESFEAEQSYESVRQLLAERIRYLMNNDYDQLMRILFRIDVNEEKLKQAFRQHTFDDMPPVIAELVIERQLLKSRFRLKLMDPDDIS